MRRKHSRITQLQELNSLNATRQRQPRQSWGEYLAANPELAAKLNRTKERLAATENSDESVQQEGNKA